MPPVAMDVFDEGEPNKSRCHTVFVDTSLDTHLAMTVEELDSVADFKKKIQREHALCFPEIGDTGINALQVKRRGFQYHLPDSMFVRNAFDGVNSRWFVYADASRPMKQGLDILGQGNGLLRLEHNVQKDDPLNGKAHGDAAGGAVMKVLEDLEIDFEHLGKDYFRTPSSDTHNRVETKVDRGSIPDGTSDQVRKSGGKRKMDESENRNDQKSLNGDISNGHENEAITAKKRHKSEKKDKSSSKRNSTKTSKSNVDASVNGARNVDTIEPLNVTNSCVNNTAVGMLSDSDLDGHKALHPAPTADGKLESENGQINVDPVKDQSHVSLRSIGSTNVVSNGEDALHPGSANEDSLMEKITVDGTHLNGPDPTAASVSDISTEKSEPSTKRKKKKTKSKTLLNQLPSEVPVSAENSDRKTGLQFPDSADKVNLKISGTENNKDALREKQFSTGHNCSMNKNTLPPKSPEKMSLENQKPADPREKVVVVEAPELFQCEGDQATLKSEKKAKRKKKQKDGLSDKKTKLVTEGVEATQCEIFWDQSSENIGSKSESGNQLGFDKKTDEVAEGLTAGGSVMENVIGTDRPDMQVAKASKVNPEVPQTKGSSDFTKSMPAVEKVKKRSKRNRQSATNPSEIQVQEKVANPSQSTDDINCTDKSVGEAKGVTENAEKNNCKNANAASTSAETAHAPLAEVVGTNPLVDDNTKDNKLSSGTEEINFSGYFVPSQQKPGRVPSGDAGNVNDGRIAVKDKSDDSKVINKSVTVQDGKKSQVGSSQESLSMCQPHGTVLHSDTESFRVPKDRKPSTSTGGTQKSKSMDKKSKHIGSEVAAHQSPSACETQKSKSSDSKLKKITSEVAAHQSNAFHEATKLNKTQSNAVSQNQSKENAERFTASNSSLKSPVGVKQTKSKKASTPKVKKAENSANRRKTLLSANIFKDDNDESSEDDEAVTSVHSGGTFVEDNNVSDVSEMEDDTGFATPITVGQRKAAEVDNESSQNKYTLEKLLESARLEKAKRAQELGIPLEDFVPDSQAELIE